VNTNFAIGILSFYLPALENIIKAIICMSGFCTGVQI
jgi:hypothetical protein